MESKTVKLGLRKIHIKNFSESKNERKKERKKKGSALTDLNDITCILFVWFLYASLHVSVLYASLHVNVLLLFLLVVGCCCVVVVVVVVFGGGGGAGGNAHIYIYIYSWIFYINIIYCNPSIKRIFFLLEDIWTSWITNHLHDLLPENKDYFDCGFQKRTLKLLTVMDKFNNQNHVKKALVTRKQTTSDNHTKVWQEIK